MSPSEPSVLRYEMLMECFRSGQMNERQMQQHMAEDSGFREFVLKRLQAEDERAGRD